MIIDAAPDAISVVWVRVADDAKNYCAIALPATIKLSMS